MSSRQEAQDLFTQGREAFEEQQWKKVVEALEKSVELGCESAADAYFMMGTAQFQLGDSSNAKKNLQSCIEYDSQYTDAYVNLGLICGKEGDYVKAHELFEAASKMGSTYAKQLMQQFM